MNEIDPICGMKGTIPAHGHFFCSQGCIEKYEKKHNIKHEKCPSCAVKTKKWYKERLFVVGVVVIILLIIGFFIPYFNDFFEAFIDYLKLIWWAILLGFLIGGIIDYFIPREYIEKYLSRHRKRTIIYSIIFGFLMSACSHGILAIAMELYKKGANTSSVIAFLLASPWANLPITVLLFGFFGLNATFIVLSALIIATVTGLIYQHLERKGMVECSHCKMGEDKSVLADFSIIKDVKRRWKKYDFSGKNNLNAIKGTFKGSWSLTKMVMWWLLIGMLMASFARAFIPQYYFMDYMGPTLIGLLVTLFFATIIEVCSEGSSPLAFEIFNQTGAFGNSFTFLMAGVATDYTEIGLIWHNIGKKAALWLPIITVPQILILGYLFNMII
jgi:uncharacterized membrane protein YraQ (UPF0718 family)